MSRKHALLSASGASKWINCTPSAVLESTMQESTSTYADEGTLAHDLAENELKYYFDWNLEKQYEAKQKELEQSEYYNEALQEYVNQYIDYCIEQYNSYSEAPLARIEETVYLEPYIKKGFSHLDYMLIGNNTLHIVDLKFGKGVPVQAENNKQALIYALGAYLSYSFLETIQTIKITIFQPRISNVTQWELSIGDLLFWANTELKQKAELAYEGKGELQAGDWCRFCKVKAKCRAFARLNLDLAKLDFEDLKDKDLVKGIEYKQTWLTDEEISQIVRSAEIFKNWINGILEYALKKALEEGKQWPGLKVVRGRSIRRYTDKDAILQVLESEGYADEKVTTKKLIPITEMEKLLGKNRLVELIGKYIDKPEGGPSLVPDTDKRPAYDKIQDAKNDFNNF